MITAALIPVKPGHRSKDRLRPALGRRARMALSRAMLRDVLACLAETGIFLSVTVVTRDRSLARACRRMGVHALRPPPGVRGLNRELRWAMTRPEIDRADRLLILPGDVPGVRVSDLFRLVLPPLGVAAGGDPARAQAGIRLVPSADGGTNALLMAPPGCIAPRFGPGSAARHRAAAQRAGVRAESVALPSLTADIDWPDDLLLGGQIAGPHTRRMLAGLKGRRVHYRYAGTMNDER